MSQMWGYTAIFFAQFIYALLYLKLWRLMRMMSNDDIHAVTLMADADEDEDSASLENG